MSIRKKQVLFSLAVVVSLVVHLGALAGMRTVTVPRFPSPDVFIATLVQAIPLGQADRRGPVRDSGKQNPVGETEATTSFFKDAIGDEPGGGEAPSGSSDISLSDGSSEGDQPIAAATGHPDYSDRIEGKESVETAQPPETAGAPTEAPAEHARPSSPLRERLDFELYWLGIYVGKAALETVIRDGVVTITSEAHSAPFISNFYRVEDHSESTIVGGVPLSFRIRQHEGKYRSNKETIFDLKNGRLTYVDHLKNLRSDHEVTVPVLWDVVSGFYSLRVQPLEVGKPVYIDVFDSNKFLSVKVDVLKRERIEVPGKGERDTVIVRPLLLSEGLFQKQGDVFIWLTDDDGRIPVKVETEVPVGKVVAKLTRFEVEK